MRERPSVHVSDLVRNKAAQVGATDWVDRLPGLVARLEGEWDITVGRSFQDGTEAFVAEATLADGEPAVLKILIPREGGIDDHEVTVLRLAGGDGCVQLLRHDPELGAMLLERLGPSLHDLGMPFDRRIEILTGTAQRVWRPAAGSGLPTGAEKGRWLIDFITRRWEDLDRPCSERAVAQAVAAAERRIAAHDDERAVLVHGDVHQWNALQARNGFKLVDPDGLLAEPEYDLGVIMREDPAELMAGDPRERSRWLAARCGLDEVAIWEWGLVERLSTGLVCTSIGLEPVGDRMLAVADALAAKGD